MGRLSLVTVPEVLRRDGRRRRTEANLDAEDEAAYRAAGNLFKPAMKFFRRAGKGRVAGSARRSLPEGVVTLTKPDDFEAASRVIGEVWRDPAMLRPDQIKIASETGFVLGARDPATGEMVGACVAYASKDGSVHLDTIGVNAQGKGAGMKLMQGLRKEAQAYGYKKITWTFDPLDRKNANFYLHKLAAEADSYHEDYYGVLTNARNAGLPTDRLHASWDLDSPAVTAAVEGVPAAEPAMGTAVLTEGPAGRPVAEDFPDGASRLAIGTPADINALKDANPQFAQEWRSAQRTALEGAFASGYRISGFSRGGYFILEQ